MTSAVTEWYRQEPILTLTGGSDFDFRITLIRVQSTTLDGKIGDVVRIGARDLTGWYGFRAQLRPNDGGSVEVASVTITGAPTAGTVRVRGVGGATWRLQQAGARAGQITVLGQAPSGQLFTLIPARWTLKIGSTAPTAPVVPDWTVLR